MTSLLQSISSFAIPCGVATPVQLYSKTAGSSAPVLYASSGSTVTPGAFEPLQQKQMPILVCSEDMPVLLNAFRTLLLSSATESELTAENRAAMLTEIAYGLLALPFEKKDPEAIVREAHVAGQEIAQIMSRVDLSLFEISNLLRHDASLLTHACNVGIYTYLLGKAVAIEDKDLDKLITGGIVSDIGKISLSEQLLRKTSKFIESEFALLRSHVTTGFRQLSTCRSISQLY